MIGIITVIFGTIFTVAYQSMRMSADDPQVQLAEDVARGLNRGKTPGDLVDGHVDMAASLAPFIIVYDQNGNVVIGSGYLNGAVPKVPFGVLANAKPGIDNRVTWQPKSGVRLASVTTAANNYYVLSARSLREVENRTATLFQLSAFGWLVSMAGISLVFWFKEARPAGKSRRK